VKSKIKKRKFFLNDTLELGALQQHFGRNDDDDNNKKRMENSINSLCELTCLSIGMLLMNTYKSRMRALILHFWKSGVAGSSSNAHQTHLYKQYRRICLWSAQLQRNFQKLKIH
jgi:hypothetical protein